MAQFPVLRLTRAGQDMVGASQGGGKLIFVRAELGDGQLGEGDSIETLSAIKHRVMQLPLQGCLNEGNGKARLRFVVDNGSLTTGFFNREIGIIAKMEGGDEQLYAYTNAGNYADYIPSKDTPIDSEIIDLHILIGNASQVVLQTANGAYATKIELEEHRTAAELDHPNKSVHKKHLAFEVYDKGEVDTRLGGKANSSHGNHIPNPEAANNARFLRNDNTWQVVTPANIGAYTKTETYSKSESYNKGEVDSRVNTKVSKSGDTMTGALNFANDTWNKFGDDVFVGDKGASGKLCLKSATGNSGTGFALVNPNNENDKLYLYHDHNRNALLSNKWIGTENNVGGVYGYVYGNDSYWRLWGSDDARPSTAYDIIGKGQNAEKGVIFIRKYVNGIEVVSNKIIAEDNNAYFQKAVNAATFYTNDWYRVKGNSGIFWENHGGGWYMEDGTWVRAWNNKSIYTAGKMKADGGFEGKASSAGWADSAGNSNTLAGQSLQWIIDRINEAKTGIVAGNLDENGWVKFANGLIVQWGAVNPPNRSVNFPISFPSKIFQLLYTSELHFNEAPDGTWFRLKNKTVSGAEWLALTATVRFYIAIGI
nr:MAG TPA: shufflon protein [Caudoviricetes sp.]